MNALNHSAIESPASDKLGNQTEASEVHSVPPQHSEMHEHQATVRGKYKPFVLEVWCAHESPQHLWEHLFRQLRCHEFEDAPTVSASPRRDDPLDS